MSTCQTANVFFQKDSCIIPFNLRKMILNVDIPIFDFENAIELLKESEKENLIRTHGKLYTSLMCTVDTDYTKLIKARTQLYDIQIQIAAIKTQLEVLNSDCDEENVLKESLILNLKSLQKFKSCILSDYL